MPTKGFKRRDPKGRSKEPIALGAVVAKLLTERPFQVGAQMGRLAGEWDQIVGERLAAESSPKTLEGGTLVIAASSGAWGTQLSFLAAEITRKANERLGAEAVKTVRVTVTGEASKPV